MSDQVFDLLTEISGNVGRIEGKLDSLAGVLQSHTADDKAVEERVRKIENALSSQRGSAKVWAIVATAAGTLVSASATLIYNFFKHR